MMNRAFVLSQFQAFKQTHNLQSDDVFDDALAATLIYTESSYLKAHLDIIRDDATDPVVVVAMAGYCHRVFMRVLKKVREKAIQDEFFLMEKNQRKQAETLHKATLAEIEQLEKLRKILLEMQDASLVLSIPIKLTKPSDLIEDIFKTMLDTSDGALSVSEKILKQVAPMPDNHLPANQPTMPGPFQISGFIIMSLNFLFVPFMYLYHAAKGEKPPINLNNNLRWAISTIGLTMGVISLLVPPAGIGIMLTMAALGLATSIFGLAMNFYRRHVNKRDLETNLREIKLVKKTVREDMQRAAGLQKLLKFSITNPDASDYKSVAISINNLRDLQNENVRKLHDARVQRHQLMLDKKQNGSLFSTINSSLQIVLACAVITGAILTLIPFTAPAGMILLTVAAAIGLASFVANKSYYFITLRQHAISKPEAAFHESTADVAEMFNHDHPEQALTEAKAPIMTASLSKGKDTESSASTLSEDSGQDLQMRSRVAI